MLLSMGFEQRAIDEVLTVTNDVEEAANLLLTGALGESSSSPSPSLEEIKMTVVVDEKLGLSAGKLAAQVAHAALSGAQNVYQRQQNVVHEWNATGQKIVVLQTSDLSMLLNKAESLGVPRMAISDAGRTEVTPGTRTCAAFGPAPASQVDAVTGNLALHRAFTPKQLVFKPQQTLERLPHGYECGFWDKSSDVDDRALRKWTSVCSKTEDLRPEYVARRLRSSRVWYVRRSGSSDEFLATCIVEHSTRIISHFAVERDFRGERAFWNEILADMGDGETVLADVTTEAMERLLRPLGFV